MREAPRIRRLKADRRAMESLRSESRIIDFDCQGDPPTHYRVRFFGRGLWRADGAKDVLIRERHEVEILLGASYPRMIPDLSWKTPIFHPNISASGVVCLGGYGTHWVPSLNLDELCEMLWEMIRYQNFDVESPYNRDAALWARTQNAWSFPVDRRPIRDRISDRNATSPTKPPITGQPINVAATDDVVIIDDVEIVQADVVESRSDPDILFLD